MSKLLFAILIAVILAVVYYFFKRREYFYSESGTGAKYNKFTQMKNIIKGIFDTIYQEKGKYMYQTEHYYNKSDIKVRSFDHPLEGLSDIIAKELSGYQNSNIKLESVIAFLIGSCSFVEALNNTDDEKKNI